MEKTEQQEPSPVARRLNLAYDWSGPDDPYNPRNQPLLLRVIHVSSVTFLAFASAFAGAIYAPAQHEVMRTFRCSAEVAVLPLSFYNLGMAFGPVIGAPLSEKYGRKIVYCLTTPVFVAFMLGAGFAPGIAGLVVCRFFAGAFASPNISNTSATILDCTADRHRGVTLGIYYSIPSLGAALAPLVGGFIMQRKGWQWTQWAAIIVTASAYVPVLFTKETYKKVILRRRAAELGLGESSSLRMSTSRAIRHFLTAQIQRPVHMLFTEPIVTLVSLYNGFIFGLLYIFVISVPWIGRRYYAFGKTGESLSYLGVTLGTLMACIPFALIDLGYYQKRLAAWQQSHEADDKFPPESRLLPAMLGSFILPVSLFVAGWTAEYRIHWSVPILFQGLSMMASLLIYASVSLFMLDSYGPLYGASASSAVMLCRYSFSFAFPMFALQMFEALGAGWAISLLGFCSLLMAPIPWCFWKFGPIIRSRSRYETSS